MAGRRKPRAKPKTGPKPRPRAQKPVEAHIASSPQFPIVGVGASAGGLAAFEAFFSGFPRGKLPGMAFVLVQHLAPDHPSLLSELIRGFTHLEVLDPAEGMRVKPNCVYVIPPGRDLALLNGKLQLLEPAAARGLRLPIDFFFRSLAQDQKELAIGVVLSGTGSDGAVGLRAIKGGGGMVLAQTPASTEFDGMPRSAIATGAVDVILPPAEMAAQLIAYAAHRSATVAASPVGLLPDNTLQNIMVLLRAQTGHDFSQYKTSTVHRRIERRMAVHQVRSTRDYLKYLQQTPGEVEALFRDLLIGVTSFFRDDVAFEALADALPKLCASMADGSVVRVWVAGCSTGEEAYSIAMLLAEQYERTNRRLSTQIFATDIDSRAIAAARAGSYSVSDLVGVSPERLERFFTAEPDGSGFQIKKSIREQLVFSEHDVVADPPFSRLDLLSCRNVLIYMSPVLQKHLLPRFYYALKPDGLLLLGTSEGATEFETLFRPLDRKAKLYQRRSDKPAMAHGRALAAMGASDAALPRKAPPATKLTTRELFEQAMLRQLAPASALVNSHGDVLYLHGRSGLFLEPAPGDAGVSNLLKMAREGLRPGLSAALHRAVAKREAVQSESLRVKTNGHFTLVNVSVVPVQDGVATALESALFLVLLQEAQGAGRRAARGGEALTATADATVAALREELRAKDEQLQRTNEELVTSTEELKSSNEEMQSVNEELQSTNEELETSKEELQSVNEELAIVNAELQSKVADLSRVNSDMNNLLAGTGIATVFVDRDLKVLRFTPAAREITNLIQSDVGRPVGHIAMNLVGYGTLVADTEEVLANLHARELEVQTAAGKWYALRIQPYRTIANVIEGAVMSFLDITERVRVREVLRRVNEVLRLAVVVRDAHDALTVQDGQGRTLAWNPAAQRLYGWTEAEALQMNVSARIPPEEKAAEAERMSRLRRGEVVPPYQALRLSKSGAMIPVTVTATALFDEPGAAYAIATTERARE